MTDLFTAEDIRRSTETILKLAREIIPTKINRQLASEYAEQNRVLPEALSPYPGPYSFDFFPFIREILDCMSESSPVREVTVLKGTQIAFTVGAIENYILYVIGSSPGPMGYATGDQAISDAQMDLRIDALINSSGIAHLIKSQHKRRSQRKTGDVRNRKEFPGGFLLSGGPRSGFFKRSMSLKYGVADEIDMMPDDIDHEGNFELLFRKRFSAFNDSYKILWGSSPRFKHNSKIIPLFEKGDQRKYFVPCKHCGHMQFLKWDQLKFDYNHENYKLDCTVRDGKIVDSSVRYECETCGGHWKNSDKDYFLPDLKMGGLAEWRPTTISRMPGLRSYHIPGLYSPVGFWSWEDAVLEFLQIKAEGMDKLKQQIFVNTFLAEGFVDEGEAPKIEAILTRERNYHVDNLPENAKPLFLTLGADVQADRIECEIVAWGFDKESWSINYHVLSGDTSDLDNDCWQALREIILSKHCGMDISLSVVDAGYRTDTVYEFADSFNTGVHPAMGSDHLRQQRAYIKLFKVENIKTARLDFNSYLLTQEIYKYLNREEIEGEKQRGGFCHFPAEYKRQHFLQLTAETLVKKDNKLMFDTGSRRNEQLDCRKMNLAGLYAIKQAYEETIFKQAVSWEQFWTYTKGEVA